MYRLATIPNAADRLAGERQ